MKKYFLLLLSMFTVLAANGQSRGMKIAYIDMEYILEKTPDYAEAKNQLELRAQQWKQEIEVKRNEINKLKEGLKTERALLTKELIEEREEEIGFLEKDLLEYQEKRFGPKGDLITQKAVLVKPIQDQVFNIVQDLAEARTYDFIFDKSSDLTILFAAQRHDISDLIIRKLSRASKREQLSSKEQKKLEEAEAKEDLESDPDYAERQKKLEDRKAERQRMLDERKAASDEKRRQYEEKREQLKRERDAQRSGGAPATNTTPQPKAGENTPKTTSDKPAGTEPAQGENAVTPKSTANETPKEGGTENADKQNAAQAAKAEREKKLEERRKALEEKRKQALEAREEAKKQREQQNKTEPNTTTPETPSTPPTEENQQNNGQ